MRWPLVETELENSNVLGWLMPILTVLACYHVGETLLASFFLLVGVAVAALLLTRLRRPWRQQLAVLLWAAAPIGFFILELRVAAYLDSRSPSSTAQARWHRSPRLSPPR